MEFRGWQVDMIKKNYVKFSKSEKNMSGKKKKQ